MRACGVVIDAQREGKKVFGEIGPDILSSLIYLQSSTHVHTCARRLGCIAALQERRWAS